MSRNVLYRIVETEAPDNYKLDATPHYFIFKGNSEENYPEAIKEGDHSKKFLKKYDKITRDDLSHEIDKYKKVQEYMLTLSDEELDNIAHAFQDVNFEKISTTELVKALVKVSPKALLKLGKFI